MSIFRGKDYPKGIGQTQARNIANAGTPNTGVTAEEYGDGRNHVTVLTVSQTDALTTADDGGTCFIRSRLALSLFTTRICLWE